jgi:hypothetical protein
MVLVVSDARAKIALATRAKNVAAELAQVVVLSVEFVKAVPLTVQQS